MKQGILTNQRVRILFRDGMSCFRIRKRGERKRKSIRGCIVSADLSVLNLVIVKKGNAEIDGVTNVNKPRRLGPKRATRIRKLFNLDKNEDVRKYVIRRKIEKTSSKNLSSKHLKYNDWLHPDDYNIDDNNEQKSNIDMKILVKRVQHSKNWWLNDSKNNERLVLLKFKNEGHYHEKLLKNLLPLKPNLPPLLLLLNNPKLLRNQKIKPANNNGEKKSVFNIFFS